jgi:hypothetical protein
MQSKAVVNLVVGGKILSNGIDHETKEVRVFMHQQSNGEIALRLNCQI